jgi:hypothetical protein
MYTELKQIVGLTFDKIERGRDEEGGEEIVFYARNGQKFAMFHHQSCCEAVYVEDIAGDLNDLLGAPIVRAEERTQNDAEDNYDGIRMWTFYEFATQKGSVTIRWCGSSNGYYSVRVSFYEVQEAPGED